MVKLPFKMKILSIDFHKTQFDGEIEFHEKKFPLRIYPIVDKQTIKIPFDVIGVQNQNALVRISGINGIALTKLDVMDQLETVKICVAYDIDGERVETVSYTHLTLPTNREV